MIELNFHGKLTNHFGKRIELNTETPRAALNVLMSQNQAFKRDLMNGKYRIKLDDKEIVDEEHLQSLDARYGNAKVHITPVIEGGFAGVSLATWIAIGVGVASVAFSLFMSRNMKIKTSAERAQDNSIANNTYTSVENKVGQGRPVPILLGEMKIGSNVGSLGIDTTNNKDALDVVS
ncbi:TPA: tail assembly protein [Escherichia coli]|nr:tail assembly protein [Escherichia coli]HAI0132179.1 tail assembly protein [Escherichia coli]